MIRLIQQALFIPVSLAIGLIAACSDPAENEHNLERSSAEEPAQVVDCPLYLQGAESVECYLASVPVSRSDLSKGTTLISFVVRSGSSDEIQPAAILEGGPGGASSMLAALPHRLPFTQVYVDQRGAGFGSSDFQCDELQESAHSFLAADSDAGRALEHDLYSQCFSRLQSDNVFQHTSTLEHAGDVADVMRLLGYTKWSVYGMSYGTTIALQLLRMEIPALHSVVLDGVYPSGLDLDAHLARAAQESLELFSADFSSSCTQIDACSLNMPADLYDAIAKLNSDPVTVILPEQELAELAEEIVIQVDGGTIASLVFQLMYTESTYPLIPILVHGSLNSDQDILELAARLFWQISTHIHTSISHGTYFAVVCSESPPAHSFTHTPSQHVCSCIAGREIRRTLQCMATRQPRRRYR